MDYLRTDLAPKKELENFNFIFHKRYDIKEISSHVQEFDQEWLENTFRQNATYPNRRNPHLYTNTFTVQDHSIDWEFGNKIESTVLDQSSLSLVSNIVKDLEEFCNGVSGRILFIKLLANSDVTEHTDKGDYLSTVRRFHIPLITNDRVSYTVNGETVHMREGEAWEINNLKPHSVLNNGNEDRVHLLIDIFPNSNKN